MHKPIGDRNCAATGQVSAGIGRALGHIERHFTDTIYLEDLAVLADLSVCRFVTVFRRQVGLPPHRFICHRRIRHAKALLHDGVPMAQAASEAGFFDQSHLSRHFKSICGVTPGRYLREYGHRPQQGSPPPAYLRPAALRPATLARS